MVSFFFFNLKPFASYRYLLFILFSHVWIRIRIRNTNPDPQSSWIRYESNLDLDPQTWFTKQSRRPSSPFEKQRTHCPSILAPPLLENSGTWLSKECLSSLVSLPCMDSWATVRLSQIILREQSKHHTTTHTKNGEIHWYDSTSEKEQIIWMGHWPYSIIALLLPSNTKQEGFEIIDWLIIIDKCKIMHVGRNNPQYEHSMGGSKLKEVEEEKDIGVTVRVHNSIKPSFH